MQIINSVKTKDGFTVDLVESDKGLKIVGRNKCNNTVYSVAIPAKTDKITAVEMFTDHLFGNTDDLYQGHQDQF